jgi:hypothetical protein
MQIEAADAHLVEYDVVPKLKAARITDFKWYQGGAHIKLEGSDVTWYIGPNMIADCNTSIGNYYVETEHGACTVPYNVLAVLTGKDLPCRL